MSSHPTTNDNKANFTADSKLIYRQYQFHEEIGAGGFGKVRLATHLLTGEKVAVKIIDKEMIKSDLPRVYTELEALRQLAHQNICRMFQYIETRDKFYIIMEYCNGGEMFDYIVRKERLSESEARHFFRQLVQAVAYIHNMGFAHRDLKPENLLLTHDLQLKLIDFGLCAKPINGLSRPLATCCGSPSYAAPELLRNKGYFGNEADIWSMGVLLYCLLCGSLPFDDFNVGRLIQKILSGVYYEPTFLTSQSREFLKQMLTVDPKRRIAIKGILNHSWLNKNYEQALKWNTIYNKNVIDEDVARELAFFYRITLGNILTTLKQWKFDYLTSTYLILLQKKERKQKFSLPVYRQVVVHPHLRQPQNISEPLNFSPTIHHSLELGLERQSPCPTSTQQDMLDILDDDIEKVDYGNILNLSDDDEESSLDSSDSESHESCSKSERSSASAGGVVSPQRTFQTTTQNGTKEPSTPPRAIKTRHDSESTRAMFSSPPIFRANKEAKNQRPYVHHTGSLRAQKAVTVIRPTSIYSTPASKTPTATVTGLITPVRNDALYRRPNSTDRHHVRNQPEIVVKKRSVSPPGSFDAATRKNVLFTPSDLSTPTASSSGTCTPKERVSRMDSDKTPRLGRRIYASLERKKDKMISLLTPRKYKVDAPMKLKCIKTVRSNVNVSVTSSKDPIQIRDELLRVLKSQEMVPKQTGWKISGTKASKHGGQQTIVELEVVAIENMDYVGVKRRRLHGDAFTYKKICEEVLRLAGL